MPSGRTADAFPAGDKVAVCLSPRHMYFPYKINIRPLESACSMVVPGPGCEGAAPRGSAASGAVSAPSSPGTAGSLHPLAAE